MTFWVRMPRLRTESRGSRHQRHPRETRADAVTWAPSTPSRGLSPRPGRGRRARTPEARAPRLLTRLVLAGKASRTMKTFRGSHRTGGRDADGEAAPAPGPGASSPSSRCSAAVFAEQVMGDMRRLSSLFSKYSFSEALSPSFQLPPQASSKHWLTEERMLACPRPPRGLPLEAAPTQAVIRDATGTRWWLRPCPRWVTGGLASLFQAQGPAPARVGTGLGLALPHTLLGPGPWFYCSGLRFLPASSMSLPALRR